MRSRICLKMCVCVYAYVRLYMSALCVCVGHKERDFRERESVCVCVLRWLCCSVCVYETYGGATCVVGLRIITHKQILYCRCHCTNNSVCCSVQVI